MPDSKSNQMLSLISEQEIGNDLIAKLFCEEYQMLSDEKIDGIWYSMTKLHKDSTEYHLIWQEDVGNYIFSPKQDEESILELEKRLEIIVSNLNLQHSS